MTQVNKSTRRAQPQARPNRGKDPMLVYLLITGCTIYWEFQYELRHWRRELYAPDRCRHGGKGCGWCSCKQ